MSLVRFLILTINCRRLHAHGGSMITSDELEHLLLLLTKESDLQVAIDLWFLGSVEFPRLSSIYCMTDPTGDSHQRDLRLEATIDNPSIARDKAWEIALEEHNQVGTLQNQIPLRFTDEACAWVSGMLEG